MVIWIIVVIEKSMRELSKKILDNSSGNKVIVVAPDVAKAVDSRRRE